MKSPLFSEEGRVARSGRGFMIASTLLSLALSIGAGWLAYNYYMWSNLTPLQRVYLPEYNRSARHSFFMPFHPKSTYLVLERTVADPKTKKDKVLTCLDSDVIPVFDEDGMIKRTQQGVPDFRLKPELRGETKSFLWNQYVLDDNFMYGWFREHFYEGRAAYEMLYPSLLSGLLVFITGMGGAAILRRKLTKRYLKGTVLRGTRELSPKEYARLHRQHTGLGLEVLPLKKGI